MSKLKFVSNQIYYPWLTFYKEQGQIFLPRLERTHKLRVQVHICNCDHHNLREQTFLKFYISLRIPPNPFFLSNGNLADNHKMCYCPRTPEAGRNLQCMDCVKIE